MNSKFNFNFRPEIVFTSGTLLGTLGTSGTFLPLLNEEEEFYKFVNKLDGDKLAREKLKKKNR